jgi:ABC-2 type transport system permease protein
MIGRLRVAFRKELTQFFRARAMVFLVIYMFAEIANCGVALTMDVRNMPLLVIDHDGTSASRNLAERFRAAPYFAYRAAPGVTDPELALERGTAALVVIIPPGFARALDRGDSAAIQLLADGTYSNFASLALSYAGEIVERYSTQVWAESTMRTANTNLPQQLLSQARIWYMPGLEYAHFTMVSMLATTILVLGVLLPAAAIVREKESGTLEQLLVTPLRPGELVVAKLVPMGMLMVVGVGIGLLEARLLFDVPFHGSLALFFAMSFLLFFTSMGLGAYLGAVAHNLLQTLLLTFALLFPMLFLSGTVVPIENMPMVMQWITYVSPLRYYLPIAQGILFKGVGLDVFASNALALGIYGTLLMSVGVRQLRRTLAA